MADQAAGRGVDEMVLGLDHGRTHFGADAADDLIEFPAGAEAQAVQVAGALEQPAGAERVLQRALALAHLEGEERRQGIERCGPSVKSESGGMLTGGSSPITLLLQSAPLRLPA